MWKGGREWNEKKKELVLKRGVQHAFVLELPIDVVPCGQIYHPPEPTSLYLSKKKHSLN